MKTISDHDPIELPQTAAVIAEVIGKEATLALAQNCKHRHIYVPKREISENHPLVHIIGKMRADKLQKMFQGELIPLARCKSYFVHRRNLEIKKRLMTGQNPKKIAQEFSISQRYVRLIRGQRAILSRINQT